MRAGGILAGVMEASSAPRVLVLAQKTAATQALADAVRERAGRGPATFHLLVPNPREAEWHPVHPERHDMHPAEQILALALPVLDEAAGAHVEGSTSIRHDPMDAIEELLAREHFDEVIISTLPERVSQWLHRDLPARVERLGIPVTVVRAKTARRPIHSPVSYYGP